jgi:glycosyltransferase involved in cell wall biosynthesis
VTSSFPAPKIGVYDGKFVLSEAIAYAKAGAKVRVLTPHFLGVEMREKIQTGITVYRIPYFFPRSLERLKQPGVPVYGQKGLLAWFQIPFLCFSLSAAVLQHACWADIIHAQWTVAAFFALPAKWLFRKKLVLTARGTDLRRLPTWFNQFIHYQADAAVDCFGPQPRNEFYRRRFAGYFLTLPLIVHAEPCQMMPQDMKEQISEAKNPLLILYVGRLDRFKIEKNKLPILSLIEAGGLLRDRGLDCRIFYVGEGDPTIKRQMSRLIARWGLEGRVSILGGKINATDYMQFCDIGVGGIAFNAVSQEYTVLGKPQILIDLPDNKDTPWKHMENAVFVKPDSQEDLADKLFWAMNNKGKLREIGENARESMSDLIVNSKMGGFRYLAAFEALLEGDPSETHDLTTHSTNNPCRQTNVRYMRNI